MRSLIFTAIVVIIVGTGGAVYLNYDQRRFENSLPKAPRPESSQVSKDTSPTGIKNIDFSPEMAERDARSDPSVETEDGASRREEIADGETFFGHPEEGIRKPDELLQGTDTEVSLVPLAPQKPRGVSLADWLSGLSRKELEAVYREKPWLKPVHEMTFAEREAEIARSKQQLIDTYGNTPEVAIINKYTSQEIHEGRGFTIPPEDAYEYMRAMSVLWPTPSNVGAYENLKALQEKGWHVE